MRFRTHPSPIKIVGVARRTTGVQCLAEGCYRSGSSGGAVLKDGRLIGILSAGYNLKEADAGEVPVQLLSFQPVWGEMFDGLVPLVSRSSGTVEKSRGGDRPLIEERGRFGE